MREESHNVTLIKTEKISKKLFLNLSKKLERSEIQSILIIKNCMHVIPCWQFMKE